MEDIKAEAGVFLEPDKIVKTFSLEKGDHVADFGAGHGYFSIPMARAVGGDGKVYALDIQKEILEIIRAKAKLEHLLNIETVWADVDEPGGSKIRDRFLDFALISNILFQAEKKKNLLSEAFRVLREGGRLAIIEWDMDLGDLGPPRELRIKKEEAKALALGAGFEPDREFAAGNHHYGLLFVKK